MKRAARSLVCLAAVGGLALLAVVAHVRIAGAAPPSAPPSAPATEVAAAEADAARSSSPAAAQAPLLAIRARAIYPVTTAVPGPVEPGIMLLRGGKVVAVGSDLAIPADARVVDLSDQVVVPGFVSAGGIERPHGGAESVSAAYRAVDAFDPYADTRLSLSRGVLTTYLSPGGHRLVSGVGAVVKLAGPRDQRVLLAAADLNVNLDAFDPPPLFKPPLYASSDVAIEPAIVQRPTSRLGQLLELRERLMAAREIAIGGTRPSGAPFDAHQAALADAWRQRLPLRIQARRASDIEDAVAFVKEFGAAAADGPAGAYLVALSEGERVAEAVWQSGLPVVVRVESSFRSPGANAGPDPDALVPRLSTAGRLAADGAAARLALAAAEGDNAQDLRFAAILAIRGGLAPETALAAITRVPAEILGVGERVGSLASGRDADFLVLSDRPFEIGATVLSAYVAGQRVYEAPPAPTTQPASRAARIEPPPTTVIKAGRIWLGDEVLADGQVLLESGKIAAVGHRVPVPPGARIIDAGRDAFVVPGFIDAHGFLGLAGDQTAASAELPIARTVAVADRPMLRVAQAGVTTVLLAPYRVAGNGGRVAAIKTYGLDRDELVSRDVAAVKYSLRGKDPVTEVESIKRLVEAARRYDEQWKKYDEDLAKWKAGEKPATPARAESEEKKEVRVDPITGTWEITLSGEPLPEPVKVTAKLRLTGDAIEGRMTDPASGEEVPLTGTLSGQDVRLEVDVDTPIGKPVITARLEREDYMKGAVTIANFSIDLEAIRVDKGAVEFKVTRRRGKTKDGRPEPPKVDEALEPLRAVLGGRAVIVVEADGALAVNLALKTLTDELKLPVVLLAPDGLSDFVEIIRPRSQGVAVAVGPDLVRPRGGVLYHAAVDYARQGIRIGLQSAAEDAARNLPLMGLYAAQSGLGGDGALRALTIDAARMYKLDDRLGAIAPGKDADLLIFTGHPFDAASRLERVIVGGREVPRDPL